MVVRLNNLVSSYHPVVWWMISATVLTKVTQFMVFPFIALYMAYHTQASPAVIGLAVGMGALTATLFGFVGGSLADKFGRKSMMAMSMVLSAGVMASFPSIHSVWAFFVLSGVNGLVRIMFQPASQAMLSDLTEPEGRGRVFAMNYWAINVGASIGPIIGGYFGTVATGWTFYITAVVDLLYAIIIMIVFPETNTQLSQRRGQNGAPPFSFGLALKTVSRDKAFLLFLLAGMLGGVGYAQIETTLPQVMAQLTDAKHAAQTFSIVISSNAIEVVILQVFLAKLSRRIGLVRALMLGQVLFTLGYVGISMSHLLWQYLLAMFVLTLGEIINFPIMGEYTSLLATEQLRGTYFGVSSISGLSFFVGPWIGGVILHVSSGMVLFFTAAGISFLATPLYRLAEKFRSQQMDPAGRVTLSS